MVLIFSTPLNLGFESSCTERRLCPWSFLLSPSSLSEAQPQAFGDERTRLWGQGVWQEGEWIMGRVAGELGIRGGAAGPGRGGWAPGWRVSRQEGLLGSSSTQDKGSGGPLGLSPHQNQR